MIESFDQMITHNFIYWKCK